MTTKWTLLTISTNLINRFWTFSERIYSCCEQLYLKNDSYVITKNKGCVITNRNAIHSLISSKEIHVNFSLWLFEIEVKKEKERLYKI